MLDTKTTKASKQRLASALILLLRSVFGYRTARLNDIDVEVAAAMVSMLGRCWPDLEVAMEVTPSPLAAAGASAVH